MRSGSRQERKRAKLKIVAEEAMKPENAPAGYTVKVILARGGLYSTIHKKKSTS